MTDINETVEAEEAVEAEETVETVEAVEAEEETPAEETPVTEPAEDRAVREELLLLRAELARLTAESARREAEHRAARLLRERSLPEELTGVLLGAGETEVSDEVLLLRVSALQGAVEAAALTALKSRTESLTPGTDRPAALTGRMLRETPVARLSEIFSTF